MRLIGYDVLEAIRKAGARPTSLAVYLYPVGILPPVKGFYDPAVCTRDTLRDLSEYETDMLAGLDLHLVGEGKDDRLRNAVKLALKLCRDTLVVSSREHQAADVWVRGRGWA